ncbi:hypothetical protein TEQG_02487 [Trichophyton equinum CBS 127.97]|uniref:Uncharacterized protein n=1 Tax=Trichophyton equinum (strain ATCC MYA-4606 / CBS 127.97) TaxID=559882 RepID=F2PNI4_TRIEC|nr:hypothetical protein TEQG_02487 [Trichophyton equinum CBS 127.97]
MPRKLTAKERAKREYGATDDDIFDQQTIKHFIQYIAAGVWGYDDISLVLSIGQIRKSFTEWRRRKGSGLPHSVTNSGTHIGTHRLLKRRK